MVFQLKSSSNMHATHTICRSCASKPLGEGDVGIYGASDPVIGDEAIECSLHHVCLGRLSEATNQSTQYEYTTLNSLLPSSYYSRSGARILSAPPNDIINLYEEMVLKVAVG